MNSLLGRSNEKNIPLAHAAVQPFEELGIRQLPWRGDELLEIRPGFGNKRGNRQSSF
jgi:hypothetical protein